MNNDKSQNKYDEIFREIKEEKLDWDFGDFLKKTEKESTPVIPIHHKNESRFPKMLWLAASVVLIVGMVLGFKNLSDSEVRKNDDFVKNEIQRQKKSGELIDTLSINKKALAVNDSLKNKPQNEMLKKDSMTSDVISVEMILPKRGRIKRSSKAYLVQNSDSVSSPKNEYESSYVMVNGQKIDNEKEAIDVAKYSLQMLSDKFAQTVTADNTFNIDY